MTGVVLHAPASDEPTPDERLLLLEGEMRRKGHYPESTEWVFCALPT